MTKEKKKNPWLPIRRVSYIKSYSPHRVGKMVFPGLMSRGELLSGSRHKEQAAQFLKHLFI